MTDQGKALVLGLGIGAVGLAAVLWSKRGKGFGDAYAIDQSARFLAKKYGITMDDARRLATSPKRSKIEREIDQWRGEYGWPESNSPLVRGFVRDRVRALEGPKRGVAATDPATMTGGQINKELDRLSEIDSGLTDEMIAAGRGHERPSEYLRMDDPLSRRLREVSDRQTALRSEMQVRMGPNHPRRFPDEPMWRGRRKKPGTLSGPSMLKLIASESRSPEEYARRAEAWASTEARPPSDATIAKAYRKGSPAQLTKLLRAARDQRMAATRSRWRGYMNQPEEPEDLID